ncbi:MAG: DUF488 family protein [Gammaproteobacteria bacterium]
MAHPGGKLWTIGHSTRTWEAFVEMLGDAGIATLVDVRRFPGSRRNPWFSGEAMASALADAGIGYRHLPDLGGRRTPRPGSANDAWRNPGFRGYADYMETAPWRRAADALETLARAAPTAIMCAEAMWWQCHRGLIADRFKAGGWEVLHLLAPGRCEPHPYTGAARIVDGRLTYRQPPAPQPDLFPPPAP